MLVVVLRTFGRQAVQFIRTPEEAERNAAVRMREMGFGDAVVTVSGSDGGIDVRSSAALAQVKWRGGLVSRPELQNLFGARGSDYSKRLLFFAASGYSRRAIEYAEMEQIALFVYGPDGSLEPTNSYAVALAVRAGQAYLMSDHPAGYESYQPHTHAKARASDRVWPFLKVHWRLVGAVLFTLGSFGGVGAVINPDEAVGETRLGNFGVLVIITVLAVVCWILYFRHRTLGRLDGSSSE